MTMGFHTNRVRSRAVIVGQAQTEEQALNFIFEGVHALEDAVKAGEEWRDIDAAFSELKDGIRKRYAKVTLRLSRPSNDYLRPHPLDAAAAHDFNSDG